MNIVNSWILQNSSGTSFDPYRYAVLEGNVEVIHPSFDLSRVVCDYCGSVYLAELVKSLKITNCPGCGSARFHFERE